MNKLDLQDRAARVTNMNTTTEKAGPEDVPMVDLSFRTRIEASEIARLASVRYTKAAGEQWRGMLFTVKQDLGGTLDRFIEHNITGITLSTVFSHHQLAIDVPGIRGRLRFDDVKISKFSIDFDYEDHTLMLAFQARFKPEDKADELMASIKRTVKISIDPPSEKQMKLILKEAEKLASKMKPADTEGEDSDRAFDEPGVIDGTSKSPLQ